MNTIDQIERELREIVESKDLSGRVEVPGAAEEYSGLISALNELLKSREDSCERHKRFNIDLSHEFRSSLALIQGKCEYLRDEFELSDDALEELRSVIVRVTVMNAMIDRMLALTQINSKVYEKCIEEVELVSEVLRAVKDFDGFAKRKGVQLVCECSSEELYILGDRVLLGGIIENILRNAITYGACGGRVDVHLYEEDERIWFTVTDYGIGIPEEDKIHIYERFYRGNSVKDSTKGFGVGLNFVFQAAALMDCKLDIESEEGKGSTFKAGFYRASRQ